MFKHCLGVILALAACVLSVQAETMTLSLNGVPMKMVSIAGGSFQMGSPDTELFRRDNETAHTVTVASFWMAETEVTQAQWTAVMGKNPSKNAANPAFPVENVSWLEAMEFCAKLTAGMRQAGALPADEVYTLPTEAQWEYACRAGSTTPFAFGALLNATMANFDGNHPYGKSLEAPTFINALAPVASYKPNAWGLYDMHGNVMEWCRDWYQADLGTAPATNPSGPATGSYRAYRGGNFRDTAADCRSAYRYFNLPEFRYCYLGFRIVRTKAN